MAAPASSHPTSPPAPTLSLLRSDTSTRRRQHLSIPETLWSLRIPLYITHALADPSRPELGNLNLPYVVSVPRFSYLALLLPRLEAFFGEGRTVSVSKSERGGSDERRGDGGKNGKADARAEQGQVVRCSSFHYENVVLRTLPVGLLVDLYQPEELFGGGGGGDEKEGSGRGMWRIVVGGGDEWDVGDTFVNGVKEADFVRNGNAKGIMSMSKEHTTALWNAVQDNDYQAFNKINSILLNPPTPLKHIPLRIYVPITTITTTTTTSPPLSSPTATPIQPQATFKILQSLVPPFVPPSSSSTSSRQQIQTVGSALYTLLPALFPSSRDPVLAKVIMHGASVPFGAPLEELMREAGYMDGWVCLIVVLL